MTVEELKDHLIQILSDNRLKLTAEKQQAIKEAVEAVDILYKLGPLLERFKKEINDTTRAKV